MHKTLLLAALTVSILATAANAQTVRFNTNVGSFDMLLNPTGNADLQPHVDNLLANFAAGLYHRNWINRAPDNFVLQLGGFTTEAATPDELLASGFDSVESFAPVVVDANNDNVVDFDTTGLTNTRGTVSLALSSGNSNSGTSSFFINLSDNNTFLDADNFIPFAEIADMATVDRILGLQKVDLSAQLGASGNLAFIDIPVTDEGNLVLLESVVVVSKSSVSFKGPLLNAFEIAVEDTTADVREQAARGAFGSLALATEGPMPFGSEVTPSGLGATSVPEPAGALLAALAASIAVARRRVIR